MSYYDELDALATGSNRIDPRFDTLFQTKRGLRNPDGSGVLVGLTTISTVIGYNKIDEEVVPVEGQLFYRGIDVADLVRGAEEEDRFGYEETAFLLLFGRLPNLDELDTFNQALAEARDLPTNFARDVLMTFRTPDIMNAMGRAVQTLYGRDDRPDDLSPANQVRQSIELIAKLVPMVPYAYYAIQHGLHNQSLIIHPSEPTRSSAENFLAMLRPDGNYTDLEAKTIDVAMVLHAEHGGGNNSTFTTRVVSSSGTDIYSAMSAALGSLKGPLHGGANVRVVEMMNDLRTKVKDGGDTSAIREHLRRVLAKEAFDGMGKIYGFGHAVYSASDPRAVLLRDYARRLAVEKGLEEELALYEAVERQAPAVLQEAGKGRKGRVSANVDFYSGFVYTALGIPREVFTPLFAMSRIAGWCAHRIEVMTNPLKIIRPAYKYIGRRQRPYTAMVART